MRSNRFEPNPLGFLPRLISLLPLLTGVLILLLFLGVYNPSATPRPPSSWRALKLPFPGVSPSVIPWKGCILPA